MASGRPCKDGRKAQTQNIKLLEEFGRDLAIASSQSLKCAMTTTKGAVKTLDNSLTIEDPTSKGIVKTPANSLTIDAPIAAKAARPAANVETPWDKAQLVRHPLYQMGRIQDGEKVSQLQKDDIYKEIEKWKYAIILHVFGDTPSIGAVDRFIAAVGKPFVKPKIFSHNDGCTSRLERISFARLLIKVDISKILPGKMSRTRTRRVQNLEKMWMDGCAWKSTGKNGKIVGDKDHVVTTNGCDLLWDMLLGDAMLPS
ncbi:hypothetical protein HAX54_015914 [Datura stramonium]|uniref:Uncharacterized protein n=1 Tax=Datura stramonium TaxID=4076 RepID=A0ABS8Y450_DATST|nr:hypothetical protein [Datura stramonium]